MNIIFTIIAAPLIGWFVGKRLMASVLYLSSVAMVFSFQTLAVMIGWLGGETGFGGASDHGAFGPTPTGLPLHFEEAEVWSYGALNVLITAVGLAIVALFGWLRARRVAKATAAA